MHPRRATAGERQLPHSEIFSRFLGARDGSNALIWGMTHLTGSSLRRRVMPVALAAAFTITACSSPGDNAADPTTASTASSTSTASTSNSSVLPTTVATTSVIRRDAELRNAVSAFWELFVEVGGTTGPFDRAATKVRLSTLTTGEELRQLLNFFETNSRAGYYVKGSVEVAPIVVSASQSHALVRDCHDDRTGIYLISDGTRVDTDDPLRHQVLMTLVVEDGVWKVSAIRDEVDGCTV